MLKKQRRGQKVKKQVREHGEGCSSGKYTIAQPDLERPTEEVSSIDTYPVRYCCEVCGFSEESGKIGINVVGLPVSSNEFLRIGCDR